MAFSRGILILFSMVKQKLEFGFCSKEIALLSFKQEKNSNWSSIKA